MHCFKKGQYEARLNQEDTSNKFSLEKAAGFDLYPMDCWRCLLLRHPQKATKKSELIYARQLLNIKVISLKWSANLVGNIYKFGVLKQ